MLALFHSFSPVEPVALNPIPQHKPNEFHSFAPAAEAATVCNVLQADEGKIDWQIFLEPEVDETYSEVSRSMPPDDFIRYQASTIVQ